MKNLPIYIGVGALVILGMVGVVTAAATMFPTSEAINYSKPCIPASGHSTQLADISASSCTGDLGERNRYYLTCTGATQVWFELFDTAAGTADTNSQAWPVDVPFPGMTGKGSQSRYLCAVDSATTAGNCTVTVCE